MLGKEEQLKKNKKLKRLRYRLFTKEILKCQYTGCGCTASVLFLILSELDTVRVPAATHKHTSVLFGSISSLDMSPPAPSHPPKGG